MGEGAIVSAPGNLCVSVFGLGAFDFLLKNIENLLPLGATTGSLGAILGARLVGASEGGRVSAPSGSVGCCLAYFCTAEENWPVLTSGET